MASQAERNARLDDLASAVKVWSSNRQKVLNAQVTFAKRVLKGRTGSERLNNTVVTKATDLLVDELDTFLTG